ncbi:SPOR domain-containing protein [Colwelliaceae bacterium BS250]
MSSPFQNRLVGTVIVAAAAIIFLPDIFDGEKQAYQAQFESIPLAPDSVAKRPRKDFPESKFDTLNQPEPLSIEIALDDDSNEPTATIIPITRSVAENTPVPASNTSKIDAAKSLPKQQQNNNLKADNTVKYVPKSVDKSKSYVIQLGSFKNKANVAQLVKKLKKSGYLVYTKPIKTAAGNLTKVFIGPQVSKAALEAKLPKLKALTDVQGRVAVFNPID